MRIGIVGSGMVGATAAYALVMRGIGREVILVDKNAERAQAEADDIFHAVPFANPMRITAGDYPDLAGCQVVILTAGVNQKPGETRLELLSRNALVFQQIVPAVLDHAPDAILVVATNPVDIMTHLTARYAAERGVPSSRVVGSGTTLDTARFRALLSQYVGVDSQHVHAYVVGEHGDSEVLVWSSIDVGGMPLEEYCRRLKLDLGSDTKQRIDDGVRRAAYHIIKAKGSTYYGIGSALARIVEVILFDQRAILTVCTPMPDIAGIADVTVALPHLLGGAGILGTLPPSLSAAEQGLLHTSAEIVRNAIVSLG
jgi:L-lactate dehydrogenase